MRPKFLTGYGMRPKFLTGYGIRTPLSGAPKYLLVSANWKANDFALSFLLIDNEANMHKRIILRLYIFVTWNPLSIGK